MSRLDCCGLIDLGWGMNNKFGRTAVTAITILFLAAGFVPQAAYANVPSDSVRFDLDELSYSNFGNSEIAVSRQSSKGATFCTQVGIAPCEIETMNHPESQIYAQLTAPKCESSSDYFCVASFGIAIGGNTVSTSYVGPTRSTKFLSAQSQYDLPRGTSSLLFQSLSASGQPELYVVEISSSLLWDKSTNKFSFNTLDARVIPLESQSSGCGAFRKDAEKLEQSSGACAYHSHAKFAPESRISLEIRVPKSLGGWFEGRLVEPELKVSTKRNYQSISVSAKAVSLPKFSATIRQVDFPPVLRERADRRPAWSNISLRRIESSPAFSGEGVRIVDEAAQLANDRAVSIVTAWNFRSTAGWNPGGGSISGEYVLNFSRCLKSTTKVQGLLTTDAMAAQGGPPSFSGGFFRYELAGLHFAPDGVTKIRGNYSLILNSRFARCLYGFGSAPLSATVTVTGDGESKMLSTSVVNEKNGWLKVSASGLTFSKKIVAVKVTKKRR
jgi:hypothetical protein